MVPQYWFPASNVGSTATKKPVPRKMVVPKSDSSLEQATWSSWELFLGLLVGLMIERPASH